jgi:hypothetical protein
MNYQLKQNKVLKTLKLKKSSRKTPTGIEVGWMVGCKVVGIFNPTDLTITPPILFPWGSWGIRVLGTHEYAPAREIFLDYEQ